MIKTHLPIKQTGSSFQADPKKMRKILKQHGIGFDTYNNFPRNPGELSTKEAILRDTLYNLPSVSLWDPEKGKKTYLIGSIAQTSLRQNEEKLRRQAENALLESMPDEGILVSTNGEHYDIHYREITYNANTGKSSCNKTEEPDGVELEKSFLELENEARQKTIDHLQNPWKLS